MNPNKRTAQQGFRQVIEEPVTKKRKLNNKEFDNYIKKGQDIIKQLASIISEHEALSKVQQKLYTNMKKTNATITETKKKMEQCSNEKDNYVANCDGEVDEVKVKQYTDEHQTLDKKVQSLKNQYRIYNDTFQSDECKLVNMETILGSSFNCQLYPNEFSIIDVLEAYGKCKHNISEAKQKLVLLDYEYSGLIRTRNELIKRFSGITCTYI